jgi:hypothetical protein
MLCYSRGRDQGDRHSKPAHANSSGRPYFEKTLTKKKNEKEADDPIRPDLLSVRGKGKDLFSM